jgi:hypothetical protein
MLKYCFSFLYHKAQLCSYINHIMTHLHIANDSWNLNILNLYLEFLKISSNTILNYECFLNLDARLDHHFILSHQIFFIKRSLSLVLYKIDFRVLKFKSLLLNPKLNLLNYMI